MEHVSIAINQPAEFDDAVYNALPEGGDLKIITKDNATAEGNPAVVLTFTVQIPSGERKRAQSVTTLRAFLAAAAGL